MHYGKVWSRVLFWYYRAANHPAKLRLLRLLERLTGDRRIVASTNWGFVMALDKSELVQRVIFWEGEYEPEVTQRLLQELTSDDVFYDVGANVGYYACAALAKGVKSVHAFEPDPLAGAVLRLNLRLNGLTDPRCQVVEVALGSKCGRQVFYRSHVSNSGMSGFQPRNAVSSFEVRVETIDSIILKGHAPPPSVLKIDVEGWEYNVLVGARRLLEESRPRLIIFEAPRDLLTSSAKYPLTTYLHGYGYSIEHLARLSRTLEDVENYAARLGAGSHRSGKDADQDRTLPAEVRSLRDT